MIQGASTSYVTLWRGTSSFRARCAINDFVKFYEIDPRVVAVAEAHFSYLADARARAAEIEISLGDARILLEHELELDQPQQFDILVVDAFSGDAVPIHLLTVECAETYWYLNLRPVVRKLAELHGKQSKLYFHKTSRHGSERNTWVLVTSNEGFLASEAVQSAAVPWGMLKDEGVLWTDDFSSLVEVLDE